MSLVQIKHLTFEYENSFAKVFDDLSWHFDTTMKTALIGQNARGKTTFLKLLMKEYPYQGEIMMSENCVYFPYQVTDPTWNVETVCQHIFPSVQTWQLEKEMRLLKLDPSCIFHRPFATLSYGEQTKVLLAVLFLKEHTFLLIDEPTNHLDQETRQIVSRYLKRQKGFLLVSHDRDVIDACCDHIMIFHSQSVEVVSGSFSSWLISREQQDNQEKARQEKLKKDIKRLEKASKQNAAWSQQVENSKYRSHQKRKDHSPIDRGYVGHKAAKIMKKAKNMEKRTQNMILQKQKLLKDKKEYEELKIQPLHDLQNDLLSFVDFTLYRQQRALCQHLSFRIQKGERVLLKGRNGCGKSSLLQVILGADLPYEGIFKKHSQLHISYVPQDCYFLKGDLTEMIASYHVDETIVKTLLRKLGFSHLDLEKNLDILSQGQKKKVMLALSLATPAHLYIWDEPLNDIDIFSRIQIENLLLQYQPTLLFVEHDSSFTQKIATQIIDFSQQV